MLAFHPGLCQKMKLHVGDCAYGRNNAVCQHNTSWKINHLNTTERDNAEENGKAAMPITSSAACRPVVATDGVLSPNARVAILQAVIVTQKAGLEDLQLERDHDSKQIKELHVFFPMLYQ